MLGLGISPEGHSQFIDIGYQCFKSAIPYSPRYGLAGIIHLSSASIGGIAFSAKGCANNYSLTGKGRYGLSRRGDIFSSRL